MSLQMLMTVIDTEIDRIVNEKNLSSSTAFHMDTK
jgi:hypothetical protein